MRELPLPRIGATLSKRPGGSHLNPNPRGPAFQIFGGAARGYEMLKTVFFGDGLLPDGPYSLNEMVTLPEYRDETVRDMDL